MGSSRMSRCRSCNSALAISTICCCARERSRMNAFSSRSKVEIVEQLRAVSAFRPPRSAGRSVSSRPRKKSNDVEVRDEAEFLEHRADAERTRAMRRQVPDRLAAKGESARIGTSRSAMMLIRVDFPRAVLADQRMDLASLHSEVDAIQRRHARKAFGNSGQAYEIGHLGRTDWRRDIDGRSAAFRVLR